MVTRVAWQPDDGPLRGRVTSVRVGFTIAALALILAGLAAQDRMNLEASLTGSIPWGDWLTWLLLLVLAGLAFGFAANVPFGVRFDAGRAASLAIVPLLCVLEVTVSFGPTSLVTLIGRHARYLWLDVPSPELLIEAGNVAAVLVGVAIAAGFVSVEPLRRRREITLLLL